MPDELPLRAATGGDAAVLASHRRLMYEDMHEAQGFEYPPGGLDAMEAAYAEQLRKGLADGSILAWVVEDGGDVVASGAVSVLPWPPGPMAAGGRTGLLHSMYTAPDHRLRGLARRIVETAIAACREAGLLWITLGGTGTDAGRHLYDSLGFKPTQVSRLVL